MHGTIVTVVGNALEATVEKSALRLLKETGVDGLQVTTLEQGRAIEVLVTVHSPELTALIYKKLALLGAFDIFVQANDQFRKKKLLIADMDATIVEQETLDELAAHFGLKDKVSIITEKAMRGELDFQEALQMRVKLLKGLSLTALHETLQNIRYSSGADRLVKTMNRHGAKCILVSGGFDIFTNHVAETLGFYKHFGNKLAIENYQLTGEVVPPIIDKHVKEKLVIRQAHELACDLKHVLAIGDGANDIPMLKKAGTGVGYFGKPAVAEATPYQIRYTDLVSVLYMQGYRQQDIDVR